MKLHRSTRATLISLPLAGLLTLGVATPAQAMPPNIPDAAAAKTMLGELQVAPDGPMDGYSRDRFPHWNDTQGGCDVRDEVLKRDGESVQVGDNCDITSGTWKSAYDDGVWSETGDVDIDHVVPLAAAWRSGAARWDDAKRSQLANDLDSPQLIAVTDNVNQEKGDKTPDVWMPPKASFHCTYAEMWVASKHKWQLTVNNAEKAKLDEILAGC
jgi:hypothetical protein